MAASYPTTIKSFETKSTGDVIYTTHITDLELEVVAIETALKTGPTVLAAASFSGAVTLAGGLNTPLVVAQGGTGLATLASAGVLVGAGTGTPTTVAPSTSGNVLTSDGSVWASTAVASSDTGLVAEGRLTLTSGTPVTTADVTGATSIYFAPYDGNRIALYDGSSAWNVRTFTQITIALGTLTDAKPYDLFAYDNSGTVTFDSPVAWTNSTTRATALTTQDGVLVKTGATTRRYIGTFFTTATTTTEDSGAKRFVWNYYHRAVKNLKRIDSGSWTYTTATIRQAGGDTSNQVSVVQGVAEDAVSMTVIGLSSNSTASVARGTFIGVDSTSAAHADSISAYNGQTGVAGAYTPMGPASLQTMLAAGLHDIVWLEYSAATGTTTWYTSVLSNVGMNGWCKC
jgi:hypothetical protein